MQTINPQDRSPVPTGNGPGVQSPPDHDDLFKMARDNAVSHAAREGDEKKPEETLEQKMIRFVRTAHSNSDRYLNFDRKSWNQGYKAFLNTHFAESKYNSKDFAARSKLFRPKTRSAVRKAQAGVASSLFSTVDAVAISPGNEADPLSNAAAALMQEVLNYRLDRTSGRNAIPWFKNAMGAVQNGNITGIVASKQEWKLELKRAGEQPVLEQEFDPATGEMVDAEVWEVGEDGVETQVMEPVYKRVVDRPDMILIPSENIIIDSGADWTDPAQSSAYLGLQWPMKVQEIRRKENDPRYPWRHLDLSQLAAGKTQSMTTQTQGIRTAREGGTDPHNPVNQIDEFSTVWVTEWFVRTEDEDYCFYTVGSQHLLSEVVPVEEVYPWNFGERPVTIGYAALEAHKIFPMSPAQSWQPLQAEINDLANLTLDTVKMNIAPIAKVKRGRQVELDKLRVRGPGTNIMMTALDDVEFDKPPGVDAGAWQQMERLNIDFDTLAGQFDQGSVQTNRQLNETVGGMRMISGAANALQEFDQRVFFETWAEPALAQVVRLCQYYEHDETILGLCGDRAKLWQYQQYGINEITDEMLEAQITLRIDVGIGAGDPQQRIAKFQMAAAVCQPLLETHPKFMSGQYELDVEKVFQETFGAAGYRDGGKRFLKDNGPPQQQADPALELEKIKAQSQIDGINAKNAFEQQKHQRELEMMDAKLRMQERELAMQERKLAMQERQMKVDAALKAQQGMIQNDQMQQKAAIQSRAMQDKAANDARAAELQREQTEHQHKIGMEAADHKVATGKQMLDHKVKTTKAMAAAKPKPQAKKPTPKAKPKK